MALQLHLNIRDGNVTDIDEIPQDGKVHMTILHDTEGSTTTLYAKNDGKSVRWYTKSADGTYITLPKSTGLGEYTKQTKKSRPKFEDATLNFLAGISPDFADLKNFIDSDMELRKTKVEICARRRDTSSGAQCAGAGTSTGEKIIKEVEMWNVETDEDHKSKVIKGFMQSGKTWVMISTAMYYFLQYKMPVLIVIQNSLDACDQLMGRVREVFSKYTVKMEERNIADEIFKVLDVARGKTADAKQFSKAMTGIEPKIFVALRSDYDIQPVYDIIESLTTQRFVMIIDESDFNDSGSGAIAQMALDKIKKLASLVWNVTATPMGSLMKEAVSAGNVFVMRKPENYKDLPNMDFRSLKKSATYCSGVQDNPFEKDLNLKEYIHDFAKTKPFTCSFWNGQKHPRISLVRLGCTIEPQLKVASYVYSKYKERIVVITYNGSGHGVTMRGQNLPTTVIKLSDDTESKYQHGYHHFPGCHIGRIIEYLQNNGGALKFPRIMIMAGKMADRGITFGSTDYAECIKKKKIPWHLTELYFIVANGMNQANLLQGAGRLCGVFIDNIPLTVFSNVSEDIIKCYHEQEELITRAKEMQEKHMLMRERILELPISREKCSKRKITPVGVPCRLKKVKDDSKYGGWDWEAEGRIFIKKEASFGEGVRASSVKESLTEKEIEKIRLVSAEKEDVEEDDQLTREELSDLSKKFEKWGRERKNKISRFMAEGIDPKKTYSKRDFNKICLEYSIEPSHLFRTAYAQSKAYGKIFRRDGDVVSMFPQLVPIFTKYF